MLKAEVRFGSVYAVKVSGHLAPVKVLGESRYGGWYGINVVTNRDVRIRSAQMLRFEVEKDQSTGKWRKKP